MDVSWQVFIGSVVASLILTLWSLFRSYVRESKLHGEKQVMSRWSVILGLLGLFVPFIGSALGLILGLISLKNKYKGLAKVGIVLSVLTTIPWVLVLVLGA